MCAKHVFRHYQLAETPRGEFTFCPKCATRLVHSTEGGLPRPACPSCGFVQHRNPAPAVSVLIVQEDQILLGKRRGEPGRGKWALPSGYVEYAEDFLTTAVREAREETGLDVAVTGIINVVSSFISPPFHFLGLYVVAHVIDGEAVAGDDLEAVAWFPLQGPFPEMAFAEDEHAVALYAADAPLLPLDPI